MAGVGAAPSGVYHGKKERLPASDSRDEPHSGEITQWVGWPNNYASSIDPLKRPILFFLGTTGLAKRQKTEDGAWSSKRILVRVLRS
jgi:hypothetical protein